MQNAPLLELKNICKSYGAVRANDNISLRIESGDIHAIIGENGAGKSTLMKVIYGLVTPDQGDIIWKGETVSRLDPVLARKRGIGMVFQHFSLFDALTVRQNINLALDHSLSRQALDAKLDDIDRRYGIVVEPERQVSELSVGERQRIEIVRCLLQDPQLIILDEPTSVLTPQEAERLFDSLRQLAQEGRSVLYISHRLGEIKTLCQRATVLRNGRYVDEVDPTSLSTEKLAQLMVGDAPIFSGKGRHVPPFGPIKLKIDTLCRPMGEAEDVGLKSVSFTVRSGEILGVAGLAGHGQTSLFEALSGEWRPNQQQTIMLDTTDITKFNPNKRRKMSMAFVPEDRFGHGMVAEFSLNDNALLSRHKTDGLSFLGFVRGRKVKTLAQSIIDAFKVKTPNGAEAAQTLSGGNAQKFLVGREMSRNPDVLVIAQPTWGVDIASANAIRQVIKERALAGAAVILISQDLDELMEVCDSIAVLESGALSEKQARHELNYEDIGLLMAGIDKADSAMGARQ